jgi:hypothetical protein
MKSSKLVSKFLEDMTVQEGIEMAVRKQAEIDEQEATREAIEENIKKLEQTKALKEAERVGVFIHSSIYAELKKGEKVKKGDTISVIRRTSREPSRLVIITDDSKQEAIPLLERSYAQDFSIKDELAESDESKDWVKVHDEIADKRYYIVSRQ